MDLKAAEHKGTVTLDSERLILRRFSVEDAEASFQNWTGDSAVTKFLRWERHQSVNDSRAIIEQWALSYKKNDFYQWAIVLKELDEPIGAISVVAQNDRANSVHIGYCIGSRWWNEGYVTEAFKTVIAFFFEVVRVNRIESQHDPVNVASGRVMEKCGLTYEGTMRQADWNNRGIVDACMYGILASDYFGTEGQEPIVQCEKDSELLKAASLLIEKGPDAIAPDTQNRKQDVMVEIQAVHRTESGRNALIFVMEIRNERCTNKLKRRSRACNRVAVTEDGNTRQTECARPGLAL